MITLHLWKGRREEKPPNEKKRILEREKLVFGFVKGGEMEEGATKKRERNCTICFVWVIKKMVANTYVCGPLYFGGFRINGLRCLFQSHISEEKPHIMFVVHCICWKQDKDHALQLCHLLRFY